jgi:membrane fusion protein, heavy metal efflux system
MKSQDTHVVLAALLCFSSGWMLGCKQSKATQDPGQQPYLATGTPASSTLFSVPGTRGIATITLKSVPVPNYLFLPAQIEADPTRVVHVFTPAGGRITEMEVRPWDQVEKGQTLAILESSDLARAVADYHKALIDSRVKQEALARATYLFAHSAIAQKDLQQAQGDAQVAAAEVQAARAQIQVFGMDPDHASMQLRVVAPRAGVILEVGAAEGEFSNALAAPQPLCTIADLSTVWAVGDIYEKDLTAARVGEAAQLKLDAYPGQVWSGRVSVVSDAVDPSTRTLHVRVVLANSGTRLKPGMFGTIRLLRSSENAIVVPMTAVIREGNSSYVFVSKGSRRYERRYVTLGQSLGDALVITGGLNSGETVVTQGVLLLRNASQN